MATCPALSHGRSGLRRRARTQLILNKTVELESPCTESSWPSSLQSPVIRSQKEETESDASRRL